MFAEIVCCAAYEKFLQASFVAQSNARRQFIAAHEFEKVDVAFVRAENRHEWWKTRTEDNGGDQPLVIGLLELKICYPLTEDFPWTQYGPRAAAKKVAADIKKMRLKKELTNCTERLAMLAISTYEPRSLPSEAARDGWKEQSGQEAIKALEGCESEFWDRIEECKRGVDRTSSKVDDVWLLKGEPLRSEDNRRAYCRAILVRG